jgi:hypothetical protein
MHTARGALSVAVMVLVATLAGCGEPITSEPSPEALQRRSRSRDVCRGRCSTTPTTDDAAGTNVHGRQAIATVASSHPCARPTSRRVPRRSLPSGDYTVIAFDFRGYGDSTGEKQFDRTMDLEAAWSYAQHARTHEVFWSAQAGRFAALVTARVDSTGLICRSASCGDRCR